MSPTVQLLKDMGPIKLSAMIVVSIFVFVSLLFFAVRLSNPSVVPLFSSMDKSDSAQISARLEAMGVYYEMRSGGAQILVPANKVLSIRMRLAEEGLPSGNAVVGYEIFDKTESMGVSSFVQNVNLVRALEGELARTIGSFDHVDNARVHLVIPKRDFFSRKKREASASVVLNMRGNRPLSQSEVTAISHLVATAVTGLDVSNITIVDTQGRPFKKGSGDADDPAIAASNSEEFKMKYEKRIKNMIEDLLSRSVGIGRVEAQVSAELDFDRIITDSETYDPNGQVARSVQTTEEIGESVDGSGGGVSAANNLPGGAAGGVPGASSNNQRTDEVTNFEISKTITKHVKESGTVKSLSIAVLVDGEYEYDEENDEYIYSERSKEELDKLTRLVKSAVGYDKNRGDKIELMSMKFSNEIQGVVQEKAFEWITRDLGQIIQTLIIGLIIVMIVMLVVRPMLGKAFEITKSQVDEVEVQAALSSEDLEELAEITGQPEGGAKPKSESLIDIERFEERMTSSSIGAINDIIERHPEEAAIIIRNWLDADSAAEKSAA
ncbi:flagellar basal-body MS-ring/collar protein FliF [Rickettsiales bacterium]|nr:flagellar basal-body MS-ring/collar protein FliF [Rickettsiales bacterium]